MVPYVIAFAGGVLVAVGGLWAAVQQIRRADESAALSRQLASKSDEIAGIAKDNAELSRQLASKSEEIAKLNRQIVDLVTDQQQMIAGEKDTFCQLILYSNLIDGWYVSTFHSGRGTANIYDLQILIREVSEDGRPLSDRHRKVLGTLTSNTWPWRLLILGIKGPTSSLAPRYFEAQITQRNGTSLQDIVVYPKSDGRVEMAFLRLEFNSKTYPPNFNYLPKGGATGITLPAGEISRILELRRKAGPQP